MKYMVKQRFGAEKSDEQKIHSDRETGVCMQ